MSHVAPICRKEWMGYFETSIGWVLLAIAALFFGLMVWAADSDGRGRGVAGALAELTGFRPHGALAAARFLAVVSFERVLALAMVPLISMRLFVVEKKTRTIEMLFSGWARGCCICCCLGWGWRSGCWR